MEVTITNGCHNFSSRVDIYFKLSTCITTVVHALCKHCLESWKARNKGNDNFHNSHSKEDFWFLHCYLLSVHMLVCKRC